MRKITKSPVEVRARNGADRLFISVVALAELGNVLGFVGTRPEKVSFTRSHAMPRSFITQLSPN
jgi:hypothetical protein